MRFLRDLLPGLLVGALAAAGQAPLGAWFVALPALSFLMHRVARGASARQAWATGTGYFAAYLSWIVSPFLVEPEVYGWMAPFALVLMAGGLALFWLAAGWAAARMALPGPRRALAFALTLTAAEALRGVVLTGFPWALPGHMWIDTPLMQAAAYVGANGLTLLTLIAAAAPVAFGTGGAVGAMVLLAALAAGGLWRLASPAPDGAGLTLRLVQPNAEQHLKWDPDQAERLYRLQLDYTAALPRPDLVIWPETSLPYLYDPQGDAAGGVAFAAKGTPVAMGVQRLEGAAAFNSLVVLGPEGTEAARYDKAHLVPFGEYVPFGDLAYHLFGLRAFAARTGYGYAAGPGPRVLNLGRLGKVLPLICYEAVFPRFVNSVGDRPDWMLQITNDAWFGTLNGPFQHAALARLRAVEQGIPLVRVANTGVTQVVDARGRVTASIEFGVTAYLDVDLPGKRPPTPYNRYGEWPFLLLLAGLVGLVFSRRSATLA